MKIFYSLLFIVLTQQSNAQTQVFGEYHNFFGYHLKLNSDFTFNYSFSFDLMSSWTNGVWTIKNDTIFLTAHLVLDTFRTQKDEMGNFKDSLILSSDSKPEIVGISEVLSNALSSGGQNRQLIPPKLFYRKNRLYEITSEGKLKKKKIKGWTNKMRVPWYIRNETI